MMRITGVPAARAQRRICSILVHGWNSSNRSATRAGQNHRKSTLYLGKRRKFIAACQLKPMLVVCSQILCAAITVERGHSGNSAEFSRSFQSKYD